MAERKWRSTFLISFFTLLSRIMGLVRDVVLVNIFGAGGVMDAFLTAFKIPNFFRRLFAEGAFANAFVPVLSDYKTHQSHDAVRHLISRTFGSLALILSLITCVVVLAAPVVTYLFAPGFYYDTAHPEKFDTAVNLLRLTFPYLLLMSLTAFASSALQSYGAYASASFAPILLNVCMIAAAYAATLYSPPAIMLLGVGVIVAGFLQLAIQLPSLYKKRLLVAPKVDFKHPGVQEILLLMLPALFGVSVTQINLLLNTVWASFMQTGTVTWLYTAERLTELPIALIGVAISMVIMPTLSSKHAESDHEKFKKTIDWALQVVLLFGIPATFAMFVLAEPMIHLLFKHSSKFTDTDVAMSAIAFRCMTASILAFMLIKVLAPGFYARKDTKTPVRVGLVTVGVNIVLNVVLYVTFKHFPILPLHSALAISSTSAAVLNAALLYILLHRQKTFKLEKHWIRVLFRYAVGAALMVATLLYGLQFYIEQGSFGHRLASFLCLCIAGAISYFVGCFAAGFRLRHIR